MFNLIFEDLHGFESKNVITASSSQNLNLLFLAKSSNNHYKVHLKNRIERTSQSLVIFFSQKKLNYYY